MFLNQVATLSMVLGAARFNELMQEARYDEYLGDDEYVDNSLTPKGITVRYRDSRYKKKITLIINPAWVTDSDEPDPDKLIRKLTKRVGDYFGSRYGLNDFILAGMVLTTDIDVHSRDNVSDYIRALKRVGKIKGFSPPNDSCLDNDLSFCLEGNSNGVEFWAYDLEGILRGQMEEPDKQLKTMIKKAEGLIRAEVRLETKAIRVYTDETETAAQIAELTGKGQEVFLDTFTRAVPFGDFHKKGKAEEIIRSKVTDMRLKRRMLRLVSLIPEKRSLLLAQKALNYRKIDDVMEAFAEIEVSPVTLSKRHDVVKLDNLYKFM